MVLLAVSECAFSQALDRCSDCLVMLPKPVSVKDVSEGRRLLVPRRNWFRDAFSRLRLGLGFGMWEPWMKRVRKEARHETMIAGGFDEQEA